MRRRLSSQSPPRHGTSFAFPPPRARPVTATNRRPRGKNVGPIAKLKLHFLAVRQSRPVSRHRFSTCARTFAATHTRTARVRVMAETIERRQQRDTVASVHQRPINHRVGKRKKKLKKTLHITFSKSIRWILRSGDPAVFPCARHDFIAPALSPWVFGRTGLTGNTSTAQ